ncbi:MAG: DUF2809 domain-containing protein [Eubacteriales bacterium]
MKQVNTMSGRLIYLLVFLVLVAAEVVIALFVHDRIVRPYVGDIIIVAVIYCFIKIFIPNGVKLLPLYVFIFASMVEVAQYFDFVTLLGLEDNSFFRILLGTSFSYIDIICYAIGAVFCFATEYVLLVKKRKQ